MTFFSRYMGTKRLLAPEISLEIASKKKGPVLDLFSGMSAVGQAVGQARPIWGNDVQRYAYEVIRSLFVDEDTPSLLDDLDNCLQLAAEHKAWIKSALTESFHLEDEARESGNLNDFLFLQKQLHENKNDGDIYFLRGASPDGLKRNNYISFTSNYGGAYFTLDQSSDIDAIRWAIDHLLAIGSISESSWRRMLVCLGRACLVVSNTTGHFAQFLKPKAQNLKRYRATFDRSVVEAFQNACYTMRPVGTAEWRRHNVAFNLEANDLLSLFTKTTMRPSVIYCDPPYTADHYSRYYHILETLVLNDMPQVTGAGLYRPDRHSSQFSTKTKVKRAVADMISGAAACGADIIISYPAVGLLNEPKQFITECLTIHYKTVERVREITHSHSTMGASKGQVRLPVVELLFSASSAL